MEICKYYGSARRFGWSSLKAALFFVSAVTLVTALTGDRVYAKSKPETGRFEYGIPCDALQVIKDKVKRNQNLAAILTAHNVSYATIHDVAQKSKTVFDVRRFKAGNPYCILRTLTPEQTAAYFIYEQDPINYVVYDLGRPAKVYAGKKAVKTRVRAASCVVNSSLYQTVYQLGFGYKMVEKLSELYAWTVDFHHLQKGDNFSIIFEEKYTGDTYVGLGKIIAARFQHNGENAYAFYFNADGKGGYYDETAKCMEKAFLKAPLKYSRITSRPSKSRLHPILKVRLPHYGTDYAAPRGTPIRTVGDGTVCGAGYIRGYGKYVAVKHNGVYKTEYLHMSRIKKGIKKGVRVKRGDVIGFVGSTGLATGPHLDFRFWKNGGVINPERMKLPTGKPLNASYIDTYQDQMTVLKQQLDTLPPCKTVDIAALNTS